MRRSLFLAVAGLVATTFALSAAPARAITGNYVPDDDHPFVGLIVFYTADGADAGTDPDFSHRCSGSLLSPTVFLTAGHCTDESEGDLDSFRIYFQQDAGANYDPETELDPVSGYPEYCAEGTLWVTCAEGTEMYSMGLPLNQDVGVVVLDQAITLSEYGELAPIGTLDPLLTTRGLQDVTFTVSGYGVTYKSPVANVSFRERLMGTSKLVNLQSAINGGFNLQTSGNGGGRAGTCSGDSGGPVFYPADTNQVVAVTSFGLNEWCRGTDFAFRVDTEAVQLWLQSVLSPEEWAEIAPTTTG